MRLKASCAFAVHSAVLYFVPDKRKLSIFPWCWAFLDSGINLLFLLISESLFTGDWIPFKAFLNTFLDNFFFFFFNLHTEFLNIFVSTKPWCNIRSCNQIGVQSLP